VTTATVRRQLNDLKQRLEQARAMVCKRRRTIRRRHCQNASWEELLQMVDDALLPESRPVMEDIARQIEEYRQRTRPEQDGNYWLGGGAHGFVCWLWALHAGSSSLPEQIPHELMLAWRNGHANHPADGTPVPVRRCEDCLLVLPNCTVDGHGPCLTPCPACGSDNISWKDISGNEVDGWDPLWTYRPIFGRRGPRA
jgi:hypothetical protein